MFSPLSPTNLPSTECNRENYLDWEVTRRNYSNNIPLVRIIHSRTVWKSFYTPSVKPFVPQYCCGMSGMKILLSIPSYTKLSKYIYYHHHNFHLFLCHCNSYCSGNIQSKLSSLLNLLMLLLDISSYSLSSSALLYGTLTGCIPEIRGTPVICLDLVCGRQPLRGVGVPAFALFVLLIMWRYIYLY